MMLGAKQLDQVFQFRPYGQDPLSWCRVRYFHSPLGQIVLLTNLPSNPGKSVANAIHFIASAMTNTIVPGDPDDVLWIEHTLATENHAPPLFRRVQFLKDRATWEVLPHGIVEDLLGSSILAERIEA